MTESLITANKEKIKKEKKMTPKETIQAMSEENSLLRKALGESTGAAKRKKALEDALNS